MTETPTERRLHRLTATSRHGHHDIAAIDKGRQAIALLAEYRRMHDEDDFYKEWFDKMRALLTACQED